MNTLIKTSFSGTLWRSASVLLFATACLALSPGAQAVSPSPQALTGAHGIVSPLSGPQRRMSTRSAGYPFASRRVALDPAR